MLLFSFSLLLCHRQLRLWQLRLMMLLMGLSIPFSVLPCHRQQRLRRLRRLRLTTLLMGLSSPSLCCCVIGSSGCGGCAC